MPTAIAPNEPGPGAAIAPLLGTIIGDMVGSRFEGRPRPDPEFALIAPNCRYTDDTMLSCAVAEWLLDGIDLRESLRNWYYRDSFLPYGGHFRRWARDPTGSPTNSFGNGAAMRVSSIPLLAADERTLLDRARESALPTHDHPDAIAAAQVVCLSIWRLRRGADPGRLLEEVRALSGFGFDPGAVVSRAGVFDVTARGTVESALASALAATDFPDAVRRAVCLGGDTDTLGAITGAIAAARFPIPADLEEWAVARVSPEIANILERLDRRVRAGAGPA